jgi:serine/threonine-protein kinase
MGEVYRATDTRLGRDVAIKVLPADVAADRDRVARFRREAQLVASLNHPNVAAIYGIEEADGAVALALELVDGEDLASRLSSGPIPVDEAIAIARQIAEGLEAAHERGIVHRDLKPGNVIVTKDGVVKVLDFGLAKAWSGDGIDGSSSGGALSQSPTMSRNMTDAGMILGTAAYMSPEQARGKPVDKRSDIWSFGVLFHEMLSGKRLFDGETVTDVLAAVLTREPDLSTLPPQTPPAVRRLIARCLERDPKKRLRDIGEARIILADPGAAEPVRSETPNSARPAGRRGMIRAAVAAALVAGLVAGWLLRRRSSPSHAITRLSIAFPPGQVLTGNGPTISRDGRKIAYTARDGTGISRLYVRALDRFDATLIPESDTAVQPFFSPDGERIGFFAKGKLMTASTSGGPPTAIADASNLPYGGTWGEDDRIVYAANLGGGLQRIPSTGGKPETLTQPDNRTGGYAHVFPQTLPGGKSVIFTIWGGTSVEGRGPAMLSLSTRKWVHLLPGLDTCRYAASGHLLESSPHGIRAALFDPAHPRPTDDLTFVAEDVFRTTSVSDSWFAVSETGTLVSVPGDPNLGTPAWVGRDGRPSPILEKPDSFENLSLSPDGSRAVVGDNHGKLWIVDLRNGTRIRLTPDDDASSAYGAWTPDGARVVFGSNRGGDWDMYSVPATGGEAKRLLARPDNQFPNSIARDGTILFNERSKTAGSNLFTLSPDGTVTPIVQSPASKVGGQFSPDGRAIAYVSDETGREEVYVRSLRRPEDVVAVSSDGGKAPVWSPDGKELFFRRGDAFLAAPVVSLDPLSFGGPKPLFEIRAAPGRTSNHPGYGVAPDGRFLVQMLDSRAIPTRIDVVENWFEELKAKVPVR